MYGGYFITKQVEMCHFRGSTCTCIQASKELHHFRGWYVQGSKEFAPGIFVPVREVSSFQRVVCNTLKKHS